MKELIIATKNQGKAKEFQDMLDKYGIYARSLLELEDEIPDIDETGTTFEENAVLKAETISKKFDIPVLADDSGLEVDALHGRPGIYSARYAGPERSDQANLQKVLDEMSGVPEENRKARFVCSVAIARPGEQTFVRRGTCEGSIGTEPVGEHGFGYDPIFFPKGSKRSMAQLGSSEKNAISHRKNAIDQIEGWLKEQR
ncbi:XTP/dITP diphosphatase [Thalassobacillus pellis]|uniref:XTP/dITP diphosphatase n=1 Tax=Thalassobacillus pellis TaxID=748008 RepID=UPI001960177D|nr:XTP/dITP diphosphatase [Thalassobacillus pellis]MBM7555043.1 XTP/dITP diphosphohydrolase [Thalassobacillus pellis]